MDSLPERGSDEAFSWNELHPYELIPERPLLEVYGGETPAIHATPFILVLPTVLERQMMQHAMEGIIVQSSWTESIEPPLVSEVRQGIKEQTGILIGRVFRDPAGFLYTVITAVIPVDDVQSSVVQVKLRPSAWPPIWEELQKNPDQQIIGWYHSHPGYGIFLSPTDRRTQSTYFPAVWQIAIVMDPIREEFGVFSGTNSEQLAESSVLFV